jgi:hypothetical protein
VRVCEREWCGRPLNKLLDVALRSTPGRQDRGQCRHFTHHRHFQKRSVHSRVYFPTAVPTPTPISCATPGAVLVSNIACTRPYTPKINGRAQRFIQIPVREWACAHAYDHSDQRSERLPFFSTTITDTILIIPSNSASHRTSSWVSTANRDLKQSFRLGLSKAQAIAKRRDRFSPHLCCLSNMASSCFLRM